jgi:hypothetical protein
MTNLKETVTWYGRATPSEKKAFLDSLAASESDEPQRHHDNAKGLDPILAAAADSPELIARIHAGRGEARRIGVAVDSENRIDLLELNRALQASGRSPEQRMATRKILAIAGMIP